MPGFSTLFQATFVCLLVTSVACTRETSGSERTLQQRLLRLEYELAVCRGHLRRLDEYILTLADAARVKREVDILNELLPGWQKLLAHEAGPSEVQGELRVLKTGATLFQLIEAYEDAKKRLDSAYAAIQGKLLAAGAKIPTLPKHGVCRGRGVLYGNYTAAG